MITPKMKRSTALILSSATRSKLLFTAAPAAKRMEITPKSATPMRANFFMAGSKLRPPTGAQQAHREGHDFTSASWSRRCRPRFTGGVLGHAYLSTPCRALRIYRRVGGRGWGFGLDRGAHPDSKLHD